MDEEPAVFASPRSRPGTGVRERTSSATSTRAWNDEANPSPRSPRSPENAPQMDADTDELIEPEEPGQRGCWRGFSKSVGSMWLSKDMTSTDDREIFVRTSIRELIVYCIFLAVLCTMTFGMTSSMSYYYTSVLTNIFQTPNYQGIAQITDVWNYLNGDLLNGIYWEQSYNTGVDNQYVCPRAASGGGPCPLAPTDRNILYENRVIGLPRLRMLRVRNDSCDVHPDFQNAIKVCYANYDPSIEDTYPFGPGYRVLTSDLAWSYQSEAALGGTRYSGFITTYSSAGSVQNLGSLLNESQAIVAELQELLWIDRGTRFITLDFTVYNANINLFCIVKFAFEFPATGGVLANSYFRTVKLLQFVNDYDFFTLGTCFAFIAFVFYYIIEEFLEILKHKCSYFYSVWNVMDLVVIGISCYTIGFTLCNVLTIETSLQDILSHPDDFADFTSLGESSRTITDSLGLLIFIAWIKLFKYISFNKTMGQLSKTLSRCAKDVGGFGVMFFIVFFAFAQLGYLLLGAQVQDYSTFISAIFALLRLILGDFDYPGMAAADRTFGPLYFVVYVFFVFFVLLNMFLAIINDTYVVVKEEVQNEKEDFEVTDYLKKGYNNMLGKVGSRNRNIDLENTLKMANSDGTVTYEEIRQSLKKYNFSDLEIEMFFCRYDIDGNILLDKNETNKFFKDLGEDNSQRPSSGKRPTQSARSVRSARRQSTLEGGPGSVSSEELIVLTRRVERMEQSIGGIVSKIDLVVGKLDYMERNKLKRKAAMSKILGAITEDDGLDDAAKRKQVEELVRGELENWDHSRPSSSTEMGRGQH